MSSHCSISASCVASVLVISTLSDSIYGQRAGKQRKQVTVPVQESVPGQTSAPSKKPGSGALTNALSDAVLQQSPSPGGDYIPCRFTYGELKTLTAPEEVLTLSRSAAEGLITKVSTTVQQQQSAGLISPILQEEVFSALTLDDLVGLTPSQALQEIIRVLQFARAKAEPREEAALLADQQKKATLAGIDSNPSTETHNAIAPIITSARDSIERLSRPIDVGCAMSILSYKEVSKAYGHIIARNYIAVQVVVRNLNRDQQFVLHDVEFAVNTDPGGRSGRFYSGRDKIIVRALAAAEGSADPRNYIVHGAEGIGALLSTLVPIFAGPMGDVASVFNGGFYPSLDKVWKDLSTDQLNLLNDTGFSSSSSSQTVVPKSGTVMFVTFIPEKQFEQGWWTQNCVSATALGIQVSGKAQVSEEKVKAMVPLTEGASVATSAPSIDIEHAMQVCAHAALDKGVKIPKKEPKVHATGFVVPDVSAEKNPTDKNTVYAVISSKKFGDWSGNSLAIFEELSTTVVAGMHIVDEKELEVALTEITCNPDPTGKVQFPVPDTGSVVCQIKGKNLDKVKLIRLRNTDETAFAEGTVQLQGGDNTTATVTFTSGVLHSLGKADYAVEAVSKTGVETATNQALHFDSSPYVTKIDPPALDVTTIKTGSVLSLTGYRLTKVKDVLFQTKTGKATLQVAPAPIPSDTQIALTVDLAELGKLGVADPDVKWFLNLKDSSPPVSVALPLQYIPAAPAVPAPADPKAGK